VRWLARGRDLQFFARVVHVYWEQQLGQCDNDGADGHIGECGTRAASSAGTDRAGGSVVRAAACAARRAETTSGAIANACAAAGQRLRAGDGVRQLAAEPGGDIDGASGCEWDVRVPADNERDAYGTVILDLRVRCMQPDRAIIRLTM
jgi:hypothetical protein